MGSGDGIPTRPEFPEPNPYLVCNHECRECGVYRGHDSDCSRYEGEDE